MTSSGRTVRTRAQHVCFDCEKKIKEGGLAYYDGNYICIRCMVKGGFPREAFKHGWRG